jgi:hypothetical protein
MHFTTFAFPNFGVAGYYSLFRDNETLEIRRTAGMFFKRVINTI